MTGRSRAAITNGSRVSDSTAATVGGGAYVAFGSTLTASDSSFARCSAVLQGGAIAGAQQHYRCSSCLLLFSTRSLNHWPALEAIIVADPRATSPPAALPGATVDATRTTFVNCTSSSAGDAGTPLFISGAVVFFPSSGAAALAGSELTASLVVGTPQCG